jgi:hypothetical protein
VPDHAWQSENKNEINKLDDEIAMLEKKMGFKDSKSKKKHDTQWNM